MVWNKQWERGMCLFCKPFAAAKIAYFDEDEGGKAQAWIQAESGTDNTGPLRTSHG